MLGSGRRSPSVRILRSRARLNFVQIIPDQRIQHRSNVQDTSFSPSTSTQCEHDAQSQLRDNEHWQCGACPKFRIEHVVFDRIVVRRLLVKINVPATI